MSRSTVQKCLTLLAALLFGAALTAQDPVIKRAGINSKTKQPELARAMLANQKSIAVTADGRLWALVHWEDGSKVGSKFDPSNNTSRHLLLMQSKDAGKTWTQSSKVRTSGSHYGSIATGVDGYTLHITWYAWNGKKDSLNWYNTVFYASYDTRKAIWKGTDVVLVPGSNSRSQSYATPDIAISNKGVIGVVFACARGVPPSWVGAGGSWNSGLLWKKGANWSKPHRINADTTGVQVNINAHRDDFWMSYRVATGGYGIEVRRFDTIAEKFGSEGEIPVVADANNPKRNVRTLFANNISHLAVQPSGDLLLLYANATSARGGGKLWFAYSKSGSFKFQKPFQIDDDTAMAWGNNTYRFYNLTRDGGGKVQVIYSKLVEKNRHLYTRFLSATGTIPPYPGPAIKLRTGTADKQFFPYISGYRIQRGRTTSMVTYSDLRPIGPLTGGAVRFLGAHTGVGVFKGAGCSGKLAQVPELEASNIPAVGFNLGLSMSRHPVSTGALLFLGLDDKKLLGVIPLPFQLTVFGMPGCFLSQDIPVILPYAVNAKGEFSLILKLPNDQRFNGLPLFWQSYVIAPGANTGNAILTNGLSTVAR